MARKQQQRNDIFCVVRADGCALNNGMRHAALKQQLHCNRGTVFSTQAMPRCKQNSEELVCEELVGELVELSWVSGVSEWVS
jgi:hypothetical protein